MQEMQETRIRLLGQDDLLEEESATHSSFLAWKIPGTGESGGLQSLESQRVGHDWVIEHTQANVCITLRKQTGPRLGEQFAQGCHVSYGKANSPISLHFINYLVLFHVFLAGIRCLHLPPTPCHSLEILISPVCCQIAQTEIMRILFANWWGQMDHKQGRRSAVVSNTKVSVA